jgi:hypothetical protein
MYEARRFLEGRCQHLRLPVFHDRVAAGTRRLAIRDCLFASLHQRYQASAAQADVAPPALNYGA